MAFAFASVPALGKFKFIPQHSRTSNCDTASSLFLDRPRALPIPLSVDSHPGIGFIHSSRQLPDANRHPATPPPFPSTMDIPQFPDLFPLPASTTPFPTMDGSPGPRGKNKYASLTNPHGHSGSAVRAPRDCDGAGADERQRWGRRVDRAPHPLMSHCGSAALLRQNRRAASTTGHPWTSDSKHPAASIPHQEGRSPRCAVPL